MKRRRWEKISFRTAALLHALLSAGCFAVAVCSFRQPAAEDRRLLVWWFLLCGGACASNALGAYRSGIGMRRRATHESA